MGEVGGKWQQVARCPRHHQAAEAGAKTQAALVVYLRMALAECQMAEMVCLEKYQMERGSMG